jgi:hypothetical protein
VLRDQGPRGKPKAERQELVRIVRFWPVLMILVLPVLLGAGVFLRRYRGTDRTAVVLAVLIGIGVATVLGLIWFLMAWGGREATRGQLRWAGFRIGGAAGVLAGPIGVALLGIRWAIDQLGGPVGEQFLPAFLKALAALALELLPGLPAFATLSLVLGALVGVSVGEVIGACSPKGWLPMSSPQD